MCNAFGIKGGMAKNIFFKISLELQGVEKLFLTENLKIFKFKSNQKIVPRVRVPLTLDSLYKMLVS